MLGLQQLSQIAELWVTFSEKLQEKQQGQDRMVDQIGDLMQSFYSDDKLVSLFESYSPAYITGQEYLSSKRSSNSPATKWVDEIAMRSPGFRKLSLESFISPSSRLTKSKLQIEAILKRTPSTSPDNLSISVAMNMNHDILAKIDALIGQAQNESHLRRIECELQSLSQGERNDLRLRDPKRKVIREGALPLKKIMGDVDCHLVLLDNAILIFKKRGDGGLKIKDVCLVLI